MNTLTIGETLQFYELLRDTSREALAERGLNLYWHYPMGDKLDAQVRKLLASKPAPHPCQKNFDCWSEQAEAPRELEPGERSALHSAARRSGKLIATQPTASNAGRDVLELLRRARRYVLHAATSYYDGTDGASTRQNANTLRLQIDAALASKPPAGEQKPVAYIDPEFVKFPLGERAMAVLYPRPEHEATQALYRGPQPEQVAQDREDAERWRTLECMPRSDVIDALSRPELAYRHRPSGPYTLKEQVDYIRAARARGEGGQS